MERTQTTQQGSVQGTPAAKENKKPARVFQMKLEDIKALAEDKDLLTEFEKQATENPELKVTFLMPLAKAMVKQHKLEIK